MKKEILIVDDEHDCAELLSYHLQKKNYQTVIARNGEEAIDAVQRRIPDAILLDVMMPELNGWEVCRILRESVKGMHLPIIMLTALSEEEERVKGLRLGADDYVSKPYSMKELLLKVNKNIERHQTIKQMKVREQEQDTTVRYMVHELKNSLTAIGGFASLALQKDSANRYLKTINTVTFHAESMLNDVSILSRLERGEEKLIIEPVTLGLLVDEAVDLLHDAARRRNVEISIVNTATASVQGNRTAIRQIMVNLISNAIKYNRDRGMILISFDNNDNSVAVSIADEGIGISQDEIGHIFDKYYRAVGSERIKGAGLGLYIVKRLITAMEGEVTVAS